MAKKFKDYYDLDCAVLLAGKIKAVWPDVSLRIVLFPFTPGFFPLFQHKQYPVILPEQQFSQFLVNIPIGWIFLSDIKAEAFI